MTGGEVINTWSLQLAALLAKHYGESRPEVMAELDILIRNQRALAYGKERQETLDEQRGGTV